MKIFFQIRIKYNQLGKYINKFYPSDKTTNISEPKLLSGRQLQLNVIPESQLIAWSSNSAPPATDKGADPSPLTAVAIRKPGPAPSLSGTVELTPIDWRAGAPPEKVSVGNLDLPLICEWVVWARERCPPPSPLPPSLAAYGRREDWPWGLKSGRAIPAPPTTTTTLGLWT